MAKDRFFRSLKEECVWQHLFPDFVEARREITAWIRWSRYAGDPSRLC